MSVGKVVEGGTGGTGKGGGRGETEGADMLRLDAGHILVTHGAKSD